ncbi:MAG: hypothetical protein V4555_00170 [Acidobacteriota bacterium]
MKSRRSFIAYLAILFAAGVTLASAQQTTEIANLSTHNSPTADWTRTTATFKNWHGKLYVVTLDHPGHRTTCKLQSIDTTGLTCAASGLHSAHTFAADNIATLITPSYHETFWGYLLIGAVIGAGILTGGAFLAAVSTAGAVVVCVFGSLFLLSWPVGLIGADTKDTPESILYQRPNTPLTIHPH